MKTQQAIELTQILGRACELLNQINSGTTDEQDAALYPMLCRVSEVRNALVEDPRLVGLYDRDAVCQAAVH